LITSQSASDPAVVADIFLCRITDWHDDRITDLNPVMLLLPERTQVIHRSEGSGTTKCSRSTSASALALLAA
jgi:phosphate transport system substrate-binding protein